MVNIRKHLKSALGKETSLHQGWQEKAKRNARWTQPSRYTFGNRSVNRPQARPANRKTDPRDRQGYFDQLRFSPTWDQGTACRWTGWARTENRGGVGHTRLTLLYFYRFPGDRERKTLQLLSFSILWGSVKWSKVCYCPASVGQQH